MYDLKSELEAVAHTKQLAEEVVKKTKEDSEKSGIPHFMLMTRFYLEFREMMNEELNNPKYE